MDPRRHRSERRPPVFSESQAHASPPDPPSLRPAWAEGVGTIHMSRPQNMVNAPTGGGTVMNITVNRHDKENAKTTKTRPDDLAMADHDLYTNQLLIKQRGHPLWVPGPGMQLPIEYRRQGISIGDVGIITSTGEFDFLFNIFQPADHPINRGNVPRDFSSLSLQELVSDIQSLVVYGPNTYLASPSVRKTSRRQIRQMSCFTRRKSISQNFESTATEAALLIMPNGAMTQDLLNTWPVRQVISRNAREWYRYARYTRGRDVKDGDIRVVIGIDKVSSWGIATSTCDTGQTASFEFKHDSTHIYQCDCVGGSGRVGPQKAEIRDLADAKAVPQNQSVFVRTINFTVSGKVRSNFPSEGLGSGPGRDSASTNRGRSRREPGSDSTPPGHQPGSMPESSHRIPSSELGVNHPSAALHNCLHERFPDAKMIITEDMDWISLLSSDDEVFPKPQDLCKRMLKAHDLGNYRGTIHLLRGDNVKLRSSMSLVKAKYMSAHESARYARVPSPSGKRIAKNPGDDEPRARHKTRNANTEVEDARRAHHHEGKSQWRNPNTYVEDAPIRYSKHRHNQSTSLPRQRPGLQAEDIRIPNYTREVFVPESSHATAYYSDNPQTFNTRNERTEFTDPDAYFRNPEPIPVYTNAPHSRDIQRSRHLQGEDEGWDPGARVPQTFLNHSAPSHIHEFHPVSVTNHYGDRSNPSPSPSPSQSPFPIRSPEIRIIQSSASYIHERPPPSPQIDYDTDRIVYSSRESY